MNHRALRGSVCSRSSALNCASPRDLKTHAYFLTLLDAGYDPLLLDTWLDALADGMIVEGMPGDLVLDFYGDPLSREEIVFGGAPAEVWSIERRPGRVEKVTVAGGKVVRVHG
jgi:hypothetical protein